MASLISIILALVIVAGCLWASFKSQRQVGEMKEKWKQAEQDKEAGWRARAIEEKLRIDRDYADGVRKRSTRRLL